MSRGNSATALFINQFPGTGGRKGMSRFQINEVVKYSHVSGELCEEKVPGFFKLHDGCECTIVSEQFPSPLTGRLSRSVIFADGWHAGIAEIYLRKRRPPEQKADDDFCDWFNKTIRKEPLESAIKRTLANLSGYAEGR